jgi:hypothetical protein
MGDQREDFPRELALPTGKSRWRKGLEGSPIEIPAGPIVSNVKD